MSWYDPSSWGNAPAANDAARAAQTQFAGTMASNVNANNAGLQQQQQYLQGLQSGQNSVSALQLRQGLQQGLAQQQSMAASASPNNAAMAARNAAMNMGNMAVGSMGQQAQAGLQERNQAASQLGNMLTSQYGTNVQGANQALGLGVTNPQQNWMQANAGPISGAASAIGTISDKRLKKNIKAAGDSADATMKALKAYRYNYKDEANGKGEQFGIMAQDLEKAGLKHAVLDTPRGKIVQGSKLSLGNTAMIARLAERLSKVESSK